MAKLEQLAERAAAALAALGSFGEGTWQEKRDALLKAGESEDSGFDEAMSWFDVHTDPDGK